MAKFTSKARALGFLMGAFYLVSAAPLGADEGTDYKDIYSLYTSGSYGKLKDRAVDFEKLYPKSGQLPQIENLLGLSFLLSHEPKDAVLHFKRSLEMSAANPSFSQFLKYNLAEAQFESGALDESQQSLAGIRAEVLDAENKLKVHFLKAKIFSKNTHPLDCAREALGGARFLSDKLVKESKETKDTLFQFVDRSVNEMPDLSSVENLWREFEDSPLADVVLFKLAQKEVTAGKMDRASGHFRLLLAKYPQSGYAGQVQDALKSMQANSPVDSSAVGVLLPMKGRFAKFGARSLQAIELAFDILSASAEAKVTLVIEDSGEDAEQAIRALSTLINKHHVVAVIGPLLSKGIDQINQAALDQGVPLISLARYQGSPNDYVFAAGLTLKQQAQQMAKYATSKLGFKKFSMIYPKDKVGDEQSKDFWDAVEAFGGNVVGYESYLPSETDFRVEVDKISGLFYTDARKRELEAMLKLREENHIKKKTRKTEEYFSLKPIVDYQAVFIPDDPKVAGQILPTFAYRDVSGVKFFGTSAWNSPEFVSRAQAAAENSLFTDAFWGGNPAPLARKFMQRFQAAFGSEPNSMDAISFDAGKLLQFALTQSGSKPSRNDVKDQLKKISNFAGVTGKISYADAQFNRELRILTFNKAGQIVEAP